MDYHIDKRIRLNTHPDKSLYDWSLSEHPEIEEPNASSGRIDEFIPWVHSLYFSAKEAIFINEFGIGTDYSDKERNYQIIPKDTSHIRIQLSPHLSSRFGEREKSSTFSMFGTSRRIDDFTLYVFPINSDEPAPACYSWGVVSYTSEFDFRTHTADDALGFYLYVSPSKFEEYRHNLASSQPTEIIFRARAVEGIYAMWSPSISVYFFKVLTERDVQKIDMSVDPELKVPRLGTIKDCSLSFNRVVSFASPIGVEPETQPTHDPLRLADTEPRTAPIDMAAPGPQDPSPRALSGTEPPQLAPYPAALLDPHVLQLLRSLKLAAWTIVGLILVIALAALFR